MASVKEVFSMNENWDVKIQKIQSQLDALNLDGWLLYDFRRSNDLACRFLNIPPERILSRRFFYWIPRRGIPVKIVNMIEDPLAHLPGIALPYRTWKEMESNLEGVLKSLKWVAMEYSPRNALPVISKVDGGTIDLVRGFGVEVKSSSELLQQALSALTTAQYQSHLFAAEVLDNTIEKAWQWIQTNLQEGKKITEWDVQQLILQEFENHGCITGDAPICAVNAHSADPHYVLNQNTSIPIRPEDFILIDLWCKKNTPEAIYADITRVGVAAEKPSPKQQSIFNIVKNAQNRAVEFIRESFQKQQTVCGYQVDDACRQVIEESGYGQYFIHRTGHSIDVNDHGSGANIDNLETHDDRPLIPNTCFSIEPGIYLPGEFGIRLEYDVFITGNREIQINGGVQESIRCLSI